MEQNALLVSVQVGQPVTYPAVEPDGKEWRSAIVKLPVAGPAWVSKEGLAGDRQSDTRVHGGPLRAVNVYPAEHYDVWRLHPGMETVTGGGFGENFTTRGLTEATVCIGDVYRIGSQVIAQVTSPRGPCYKINRRWNVTGVTEQATEEGRTGWYLSVMQEGYVQPGDLIIQVERKHPTWSVARVWSLLLDPSDKDAVRELLAVEELAENWKKSLRKDL